jgi:hypothetical protein
MDNIGSELKAMENLREDGDFEKLAKHVPTSWDGIDPHQPEGIQMRLLVAEVHGREGKLDQMALALEPYIDNLGEVPFALAARVLLMISVYRNRNWEHAEELRV